MARRSLRVSDVATARSSSKRPTPSDDIIGKKAPKAKRAKVQDVTRDHEEEPEVGSQETDINSESDPEDAASAFGGSSIDDATEDDIHEEQESELSDEEEEPPRGRKPTNASLRNGQAKGGTSAASKDKSSVDVSKPGTKTGLGPGTQVIIKKPRARSPGKIPYTDETIHPNTMLFLTDLAKNNDRQWLKLHDLDYRASWKDFETFLDALTQGIITVDETIPELPIKDIIFRIYRDVRFSKDQTPYKTAFSAAWYYQILDERWNNHNHYWSRTGRKGPYAVYYLQIKPNGGSMIAGGLWAPEAPALAALRRNIDKRPEQIKALLCSRNIRKEYLGGVSKDEGNVVARFVGEHAQSSLKTRPKGFNADHKDIALLRLKNFTLHRKLSDEEVTHSNAVGHIVGLISHLVPYVTYLNNTIRPDEQFEDEDDEASMAGG